MWKDPGRLAEGIEAVESPLDIDRSRDKRRSQDMLINLKREKQEKQEKKEKKFKSKTKRRRGVGEVKKLTGTR